jgi:HK97 family phage prohead protease
MSPFAIAFKSESYLERCDMASDMRTTPEQRRALERLMAPIETARLACELGERHKRLDVRAEEGATGEFHARISDWAPDREGERFARHAFDGALAKLCADGRPIPVLFGHDARSVQAVLGHVMPSGLEATAAGLHARGWVDISTDVGRRVFDMLKRDVLRWSIGFRIARSHREPDGRVIDEVDELLELSAVPVPANGRTATLGVKHERLPSRVEQEVRMIAAGMMGETVHPHTGERLDESLIAASAEGQCDARARHCELVASTAAQRRRLGQIQLDVLMGGIEPESATETAPAGPTDVELRERAEALGITVRRPRSRDHGAVKATARAAVLALLAGTDG